jgi:hypothetical protein
MVYKQVPVQGRQIALYKGLQATAGPDENGKARKGAQMWHNGLRSAEKSGRAVPPVSVSANGQLFVDVASFAEAMMFPPTSRGQFVEILRDQPHEVTSLYKRTGLDEAEVEALMKKALEDFIEPLDAIASTQREVAVLLDRDPATVKQRCTKYCGRVWIFSVFDGIALMLNCSSDDSAVNHAYDRMVQLHPSLNVLTNGTDFEIPLTFQFEGQGERPTPVRDLRGYLEMLLLVPGPRAAVLRKSVIEVFIRKFGGDLSMINEILAAHEVQQQLPASHPATAFADAVQQRPSPETDEEGVLKRRRLEVEAVQLDAEYDRAKAISAIAKRDADTATIALWQAALTAGSVCPAMALPPSASVRIQDMMQTMMFGTARDEPELGRPICPLSELRKAGLPENQLSCLGKQIKARVLEMFPGEEISTRLVYRNGHEIETKCYFEKHRPAVEAALEDIRQKLLRQAIPANSSSSTSRPQGLTAFFAPRAV